MVRAILHFDADAFFASVEQAADRYLRGKPVAVGHLHRGIVASASYEARRYGVYTPMPMVKAQRRCPQLIVVPPHFDLYEQFSINMFGVAQEFTPLIEKQSIDEGYLDLTGTPRCMYGDAPAVARKLKTTIRDWLKVTISEGLASTKLLSQIASKLYKPDGLKIIPPQRDRELQFLHPLAVKWLPGIGEVGAQLMQSAGVTCIGQVARLPLNWLSELVGRQAVQIRALANNIDHRPVESAAPEARSYGHQETFAADTADAAVIDATLRRLTDQAFQRVRSDGKQIRTITVKIRYTDMIEHQVQGSMAEPTDVPAAAYALLSRLLGRVWTRRVRLRMVQVKLSNVYNGLIQGDLFGLGQRQRDLALVCDAIHERFGRRAMMRAHDWLLDGGSRMRRTTRLPGPATGQPSAVG